MKNHMKVYAIGLLALLAASTMIPSTRAGVTASQGLGYSWVGSPDIMVCNPPGTFTTGENEYSTNPPTAPFNLGQSFTVTNTHILTNIQIYVSGTSVSNIIHLYDLGVPTGGTNPIAYTPGSDLFSGLGFQYYGGNSGVLRLQFTGADAVTLTNGHQYVFEIVPAADKALTWYRSSSTDTFPAGEAYRCQSLFNGTNRDFAMAVTYFTTTLPAPLTTNFWVTVSAAPMTNVWPGSPMIQTFSDPSIADEFATPATGVPEGFGPASNSKGPGRVIGMTFVQTNKSFNLGAVTIRMHGVGSSNVVFFLSLYSLTNNMLVNTNAMNQNNRYPSNYKPLEDSSPLGISLLSSNLVGCRITPDKILSGVAPGTNDELLTFNFTDPQAQALLQSCSTALNPTNGIYAFEITIGTNQAVIDTNVWANNATNIDSLFQWIRGTSGNSTFEKTIYTGDIQDNGYGYFTNIYAASVYALPRAYEATAYTNSAGGQGLPPSDPSILRTPVAGQIRDMVMAVYAAPPRITGGAHSGNSFVLTLQSSVDGGKIAVLKKANLLDPAWTMLATNYPAAGIPISSSVTYTDTTASATMSFYRITSSP
jgi:hypothetical protein